jgi:hypothetical protein
MIRIRKGTPTDDELAALTLVLTALTRTPAPGKGPVSRARPVPWRAYVSPSSWRGR